MNRSRRFLAAAAVLVLAIGTAAVLAQDKPAPDWQELGGDELRAALAARVLGYADGATQQFGADGRTDYESASGARSTGDWRVQDGRYCSRWPPADRWDCYLVERSARGLDLRFTGADGVPVAGRYIDLR